MDKMREEFEAWYGEQFKYSDKKLNRHGETYLSPFVGGLWSAWQASRAALVVELPGAIWCSLAYHEAINDVKEALDDAGVGYK